MATKIKLPVLAKNKNVNMALYVLIAGLIVFAIYKGYKWWKNRNGGDSGSSSTSSGSGSGSSSGTAAITYTDSSVFSVKSPMMTDKRVQWIQNKYNQIANLRKSMNISPSWPIIKDDGIYGNNTATAVNRVLAKKTTSWSEFSPKADAVLAQLNKQALGIPDTSWETDEWGYGY